MEVHSWGLLRVVFIFCGPRSLLLYVLDEHSDTLLPKPLCWCRLMVFFLVQDLSEASYGYFLLCMSHTTHTCRSLDVIGLRKTVVPHHIIVHYGTKKT